MHRIPRLLFLLTLTTSALYGQTPAEAPQRGAGTGTLVPNTEIQAVLQHLDAKPVVDFVLRVVSINAEYNVGVSPNTPRGFSEIISDQITYLLVRVDPHRVLPESGSKP